MNKSFIALLLVAAAGVTFYFFSDRFACGRSAQQSIKEKIIAAWETDSVFRVKADTLQDIDRMMLYRDSNRVYNKVAISFTADGAVYMHGDSLNPADSFQYQWKTDSVFTWKPDSGQVLLTIKKLTADSLLLETGTKELIWFHKLTGK